MAYLYRHIRLDKNQPFYIGIGSDEEYKRAYNRINRTRFWKSIAKNGYECEILLDDLSWEDACKKEIEFIKLYGRADNNTGILCNMTDGGEGVLGRKLSNEAKKKISESSKKLLGRKLTEEHRQNIKKGLNNFFESDQSIEARRRSSERNKGKWIGRAITDEQKRKISESLKGKTQSEETKKKRSAALKGRVISEEVKEKMRQAAIGRKANEETKIKLGLIASKRVFSEETKEKLRVKAIAFWQKRKSES